MVTKWDNSAPWNETGQKEDDKYGKEAEETINYGFIPALTKNTTVIGVRVTLPWLQHKIARQLSQYDFSCLNKVNLYKTNPDSHLPVFHYDGLIIFPQ